MYCALVDTFNASMDFVCLSLYYVCEVMTMVAGGIELRIKVDLGFQKSLQRSSLLLTKMSRRKN